MARVRSNSAWVATTVISSDWVWEGGRTPIRVPMSSAATAASPPSSGW